MWCAPCWDLTDNDKPTICGSKCLLRNPYVGMLSFCWKPATTTTTITTTTTTTTTLRTCEAGQRFDRSANTCTACVKKKTYIALATHQEENCQAVQTCTGDEYEEMSLTTPV